MTEPIDPALKDALANLTPGTDAIDHETREKKLQEVSNLVIGAATTIASELGVFQPAESGFSFDLANLTWSGNVWLMHSSLPAIFVKPVISARFDHDNLILSAASEGESEETLLTAPSSDVTQASVYQAVKRYFEPRLTAAIKAQQPS